MDKFYWTQRNIGEMWSIGAELPCTFQAVWFIGLYFGADIGNIFIDLNCDVLSLFWCEELFMSAWVRVQKCCWSAFFSRWCWSIPLVSVSQHSNVSFYINLFIRIFLIFAILTCDTYISICLGLSCFLFQMCVPNDHTCWNQRFCKDG